MAKLVFQSGPYTGKSVGLPPGRSLTMGRNRDLELPLPDLKLSRRHCTVGYEGERCFITDHGSTNGTFINGERIEGKVELNDFDRIVLGDTELEFHYADKVPIPGSFDPDAIADPFGVHGDAAGQAAAGGDPLEEALSELDKPLPPEPEPLAATGAVAEKLKVLFCEACEGSITTLDYDLGAAREIDGNLICKECLAKGVDLTALKPAAAERAVVHAAVAAPAPEKKKKKSMSDILAALDDEAVVVDTTIKRGGHVIPDEQLAQAITMQQAPKPAAPPKKMKDIKEELGEEFEEIG